jgi:hypothetical protein
MTRNQIFRNGQCYVISNYSFFPRGYSKKMAGSIKSYNKRGEQTFNTKYTGK